MKNTIRSIAITGVLTLSLLSASAQENKDAFKKKNKESEVKKETNEAKTDSSSDFAQFKKDGEAKISNNKNKITELRTKKAVGGKESYEKKLLVLEQKNDKLKTKIESCGTVKSNEWTSFKNEFDRDMEELERAIKDLGGDTR